MKDLDVLRALLAQNGLIAPERAQAGSMEIVPILGDMLCYSPMYIDLDQPPDIQEGGSCQMCSSGCSTGCSSSCVSGCPTACSNGCTACCQL